MLRNFVALAALLAPASAEILIVDAAGGGNHLDIQAAVASATSSDVILVRPGTYGGVLINDQTVRIIASDPVQRPLLTGPIHVFDLAAGKSVVLSGLEVNPILPAMNLSDWDGHALLAINCDGSIRVQDCKLTGNQTHTYTIDPYFFHAISVEDAADVAITTCDAKGGRGDHGLLTYDSQVSTAQSVFTGGTGFNCDRGGNGAFLTNTLMFDSASLLLAGNGQWNSCGASSYYGYYGFGCGTNGGDGIRVGSFPSVSAFTSVETVLMAGMAGNGMTGIYGTPCNGTDGSPATGIAPNLVAGTARRSSYAATLSNGGVLNVSLTGVVGDQVTLILATTPQFDSTGSPVGVRLVGPPVASSVDYIELSLGTLSSPTMDVQVLLPLLAPGAPHKTWFAQTLFTDASQSGWYGPGRTVLVLEDPSMNQYADLCSGDGGNQAGCTDCPCSNNTAPGTVGGCLNSAGNGARLIASGDPSVSLPAGALADLRFSLLDAPPSAFCILNSGDAVAPQGLASPCFGLNSGVQSAALDGLRCAVQNTRRHGGRSADTNGAVGNSTPAWGGEGNPQAGLAQAASFVAGQSRAFQVFHRDDPLAVCMRGLGTSQAVEVTFAP